MTTPSAKLRAAMADYETAVRDQASTVDKGIARLKVANAHRELLVAVIDEIETNRTEETRQTFELLDEALEAR